MEPQKEPLAHEANVDEKRANDAVTSPHDKDNDDNKDEPAEESEKSDDGTPNKNKKRTSPRRLSTRVLLKAGSRLHVPREDEGGCARATVVGLREGGTCLVVHDDLYWVGYRTDELTSTVRRGDITYLGEEDDVEPERRVCFVLTPKAGQPPDCFLVGELLVEHEGWRLFRELRPAPENGKFGQRFSQPRIPHVLSSGMQVTLSGKAAALKRNEKLDRVSSESSGTFLGVVDASLPSQHCFWALVQIGEMLLIASLFGKDGEGHVHLAESADQPPATKVASMLSAAQVSILSLFFNYRLCMLTAAYCHIGCAQGSLTCSSELSVGHKKTGGASGNKEPDKLFRSPREPKQR